MISTYLRMVAARRAYTAAQNRDLKAYVAWQMGDRTKGKTGVLLCDETQAQVTAAWRRLITARHEWRVALGQED